MTFCVEAQNFPFTPDLQEQKKKKKVKFTLLRFRICLFRVDRFEKPAWVQLASDVSFTREVY